MQTNETPYFSVIIPSFRSAAVLEKNLPLFIDHLKTLDKSFELIVVDDGSADNESTKKRTIRSEWIAIASVAIALITLMIQWLCNKP